MPYNHRVPTVGLTTLGCKVNQYETQRIADGFEELGFEIVPFDAAADVYVVNTCSVTGQAESKSRYTLRRALRANPSAVRVVTGCASQLSIARGEDFPLADLVVPNPDKLSTPGRFAAVFPRLAEAAGKSARTDRLRPRPRTRATLKVQDGCDVKCSFCSIPYSRPKMQSRPVGEVLAEAQRLAQAGTREAVLTGVLIGSYGPETGSGGPDFEDLVALLAAESGLERLRISSIEVQQVTPRLLELAAQGCVVPHFHIPLQSGDDGTLADMGRRYRQRDYVELVQRAYETVPGLCLTTDIMVGFPTENLSRFESTLHVCLEAQFLKAHVFRFSPRPGTPADSFGDPVPNSEKTERAKAVSDATGATALAVTRRFLGRTLRVIVEGAQRDDGLLEGLADNGIVTRFVGSREWRGTVRHVRLDEVHPWGAVGEVVARPERGVPIAMLS